MRKKILILDHDRRFTGSTKSLLYFLDVLAKKDFEILLLTSKSKDYYQIYEKYNIEISEFNNWYNLNISSLDKIEFTSLRSIYSILLSAFRFMKGIVRSFKELKKNSPNLLFINEVVLMQFAIASFVLRIPTIIYVRTNFTKGRFGITGLLIRKLLLLVSTNIIVISKNEYQQFKPQKNKIALKKIILVRELLNNSDFKVVNNIDAIKAKYKLPTNIPIILMLGGIQRYKGSIDLLKALKHVIKKQKKIYVVILGKIGSKNDPYTNKCFSFIENNNLKRYLEIIDEVEDVDDFIAVCDILISANIVSHFSRPVIEAWAKKKAVISSDFPHSREIINNYENGILYPSGNTDQLAESIIKLIADKQLYSKIASNGYKTSKNYFDAQNNSAILIKLVNKLIG